MAMTFPPPPHENHTTLPLTCNLGEHALTIATDGTLEITDTQTVTQLTPDEAYKLLITLQTLFA